MIEYRRQQRSSTSRAWRGWRRNKKEQLQQTDVTAGDEASNPPQDEEDAPPPLPKFSYFARLPNEIKLHILSFVAQASLENHSSTLTHTLPLVSRELHSLSTSDSLWQPALEHLVETEPSLWRQGILKLCSTVDEDTIQNDTDGNRSSIDNESMSQMSSHQLVSYAHSKLRFPGYFRMYRMVVARFMRFASPIFCMQSGRVQLGRPISLFLFEPRYRLMIQMVMEGYHQEYRDGQIIPTTIPRPSFVYAYEPPFTAGRRACLVEVKRCFIDEDDGTANVLIMPVAFLKMELVWTRPNTHHLRFAQCLRLKLDGGNSEDNDDGQPPLVEAERVTVDSRRQCMPCCIS